jgi:hypothetical protein
MIDAKRAADILDAHDHWVTTRRVDWVEYRHAYANRFWEDHKNVLRRANTNAPEPIKVQINMVRAEIDTLVAGMFHRGMRTSVRPDDVVADDEPENIGDVSAMIALLLDRWLASREVEALAEQGMSMGLMYDEIAFMLGLDPGRGGHPLEQVWLAVLPPWEGMWDRKARSLREMRYIGHVHYMAEHEVRARWDVPKDLALSVHPDLVEAGLISKDPYDRDDAFVRVLEFYDLTDIYEAIDGDGNQHRADGTMRVWLLGQSGRGLANESGLLEVFRGPIPFTDVTGRPLPTILPLPLVPLPEFPLQGVPHIGSVYEQNAERNYATTFLANHWRKMVVATLLVNKSMVDEDAMNAMTSGEHGAVASLEIGKGEDLSKVAQWLEQQGTHPAILEYIQHLDQSAGMSRLTSDTTRGRSVPYASATEIVALNDYSETNTGRTRKKVDKAISLLCGMYLRILAATMEEKKTNTFKVRLKGEAQTFERAWFDLRWEISLTDFAATPINQAQRRGDFAQIGDKLIELVQIASQVENPLAAYLAQVQIDYIVRLWDLPEDMMWSAISARAAAPPAAAPGIESPQPGAVAGTAQSGAAAAPPVMPVDDPAMVQAAIDATVQQDPTTGLPSPGVA